MVLRIYKQSCQVSRILWFCVCLCSFPFLEPQSNSGWKGPPEVLQCKPLLKAGLIRSACSGICPACKHLQHSRNHLQLSVISDRVQMRSGKTLPAILCRYRLQQLPFQGQDRGFVVKLIKLCARAVTQVFLVINKRDMQQFVRKIFLLCYCQFTEAKTSCTLTFFVLVIQNISSSLRLMKHCDASVQNLFNI